MIHTEIAIIGAGAAGLMAAAGAAKEGAGVLVLEKMPRPGRKIMISGKGRCNMTNLKDWNEFSLHIHPKAVFLKNAFYNFSSDDTVRFFGDYGLETVTERGDRVFPASYKAADVVDTLMKAAVKPGSRIMTDVEVSDITKSGNGFIVTLASGEDIYAEKVIIATGGLSYPATGSTGDGYRWAEKFGHNIRHCFPSLTALVPADYKISGGNPESRGHISRDIPVSESGRPNRSGNGNSRHPERASAPSAAPAPNGIRRRSEPGGGRFRSFRLQARTFSDSIPRKFHPEARTPAETCGGYSPD